MWDFLRVSHVYSSLHAFSRWPKNYNSVTVALPVRPVEGITRRENIERALTAKLRNQGLIWKHTFQNRSQCTTARSEFDHEVWHSRMRTPEHQNVEPYLSAIITVKAYSVRSLNKLDYIYCWALFRQRRMHGHELPNHFLTSVNLMSSLLNVGCFGIEFGEY